MNVIRYDTFRNPAKRVFLALAFTNLLGVMIAQQPKVSVSYEQQIANANFPELMYWFVTPETLDPQRYEHDIQHISHDTLFGTPFLTERNGVDFADSPAAHAAIAGIVRDGHAAGLHIGATLSPGTNDGRTTHPLDDDQTVVSEAEKTLDPEGRAVLEPGDALRLARPVKTELLRVFVFRKTLPAEYDPATFEDVTAKATATSSTPGAIAISVDLGPKYAGYTAYAMSTTWFNTLDLVSDAFHKRVREVIDQYKDVQLDGTSLDEFGYTRIPMRPVVPFRGHLAGRAYAAEFEKATGMPFTQTIFETRYAPTGHPEVRIKAIDAYWDFHRKGALQGEQEFFNYSRQTFGNNIFSGIHNTFHNHLTNDEAWATGINWWTIPRQYGQSDEDLSLPLRMGLLVSHPGNIMYDQYYGSDVHRFAVKALNDARFDARLHYHGYNDTGRWGIDLSTDRFLSVMNPVERKIRLLNRFDPAPPALPLLVVFGMPALLNWYPDVSARNEFDVNGSLHIEEKVSALWDAGYRLAVVPSELIDNGALKLDAQNRPVLNGHTFSAVVYLYPEYAKASTLDFLDRYTRHGGALMLEGNATRDFNGTPVADLFHSIESRARVKGFSVDDIPRLGIAKDPLQDIGGRLADGSVILTDLASIETAQPHSFSITVAGHVFSGAYTGVFALKTGKDGQIEKLACGDCGDLSRDGKLILQLKKPADVVLHQTAPGTYSAVLNGAAGDNSLKLHQ